MPQGNDDQCWVLQVRNVPPAHSPVAQHTHAWGKWVEMIGHSSLYPRTRREPTTEDAYGCSVLSTKRTRSNAEKFSTTYIR